MKNINLLPSNVKFDYERLYIIKLIIYALLFNISLLIVILVNENIVYNSLNNKLKDRKQYLQKITQLNINFQKHQQEYKKLKQYLNNIKEKEKTFFTYYDKAYSPIVSVLIYLDSIKHGIYIDSFQYSNGVFVVDGRVDKSKNFYRYYKALENNPYIAELDFSNLTANKDSNDFSFNISFKTRKLNEIF